MATRDQLLKLFEAHKGIYFSGEEIAQMLSVSRAAIWKAVNSLRQEGYPIDAVTNKGYCLSGTSDILSVQGVEAFLQPQCRVLQLQMMPRVSSTNLIVREKANAGAPEGLTVIANEQTAGRGRYGRSFYSPEDTGVYLSLLLRPTATDPSLAVHVTTMAAVAMCEAIETVSGERPEIKWVNDIYLRGKKVCGILTEGSFSMESGQLEYAVMGIGINVSAPRGGFPEELQSIAGSVFEDLGNERKNRLTGEFLNRFMACYQSKDSRSYTEKYRNYSMVVGKQVTVLTSGSARKALAMGIDDQCHLLVQYEDGSMDSLSYGEIQIRL